MRRSVKALVNIVKACLKNWIWKLESHEATSPRTRLLLASPLEASARLVDQSGSLWFAAAQIKGLCVAEDQERLDCVLQAVAQCEMQVKEEKKTTVNALECCDN